MNYITPIILLLFSVNVLAQDFELLKIQTAYYPSQAIEESSVDAEVGFLEWSGRIALPQVLKDKRTILIHRLGYGNLRVDADGTFGGTAIENTKHYHSIFYSLGLIKIVNLNWRLLISVNPTLASDFSDPLSNNDLLFQGSAIAMNTKNTNFQYGFGVAYTTRFGRQLVAPAGLLKYSTPKLTLEVLVPTSLSVIFNKKKRFNYGVAASLNGGLFNNAGESPATSAAIDETGYSRLNIGPTFAFKLNDALKIDLTGGMAVGRRLEFIDPAEEIFDRAPEPGPFVRLGLSVIPPGKNEDVPSINL
ncbi:MAG: DUF6268 family outer membrane beta-barrel protein [Bacteroidota bacterium]